MAEESFTMRNRRAPAIDADDRPRRARFVIDAHAVKPSTAAAPVWPFGNLARTGVDELADLATGPMFGADLASSASKRRRGARRILTHLLSFEGATWQKRWEASGLDTGEYPISCLAEDLNQGYETTNGLRAPLFMRVIRPSLPAFRVNKFHDYPNTFRTSQGDPLLDKFFEEAAGSRAAPRHQWRALVDVTCALTTQGIALRDLTPEGLLYYSEQCRRLQLVLHGRRGSNRFAGLLAWEILHGMGHFPQVDPVPPLWRRVTGTSCRSCRRRCARGG